MVLRCWLDCCTYNFIAFLNNVFCLEIVQLYQEHTALNHRNTSFVGTDVALTANLLFLCDFWEVIHQEQLHL